MNLKIISYKLIDKNYPKGFTLIEVLLYVTITSIIFLGIMAFADITIKGKSKQDIISRIEEEGNLISGLIIQRIKNARSISIPAASSTAISLTLVMPGASINPTNFNLSGNTITISERGLATTSLNSSQVLATSLVFTNLSRSGTAGAVRFEFTLRYNNPLNLPDYDYSRHFISGASMRPN